MRASEHEGVIREWVCKLQLLMDMRYIAYHLMTPRADVPLRLGGLGEGPAPRALGQRRGLDGDGAYRVEVSNELGARRDKREATHLS